MTAKTPEDIDPTWMEAFNAGDADGVLALYEPGAAFVLPTGDIAEGLDAIRQTLDGFLAMKPRIDLRTNRVVRAGDTAVLYSAWSLAATGPDGNPVEMAGSATVVVREQPDGTWQFVIDDPGWGKG